MSVPLGSLARHDWVVELSVSVGGRGVRVELELAAVAELVDTVAEVGDGLNPGLAIGHVLVVAADQRQRLDLDVIAALRERFPDATLATVISRSVRIRESYNRHQPVTVYDPHRTAAQQYRDAARELLQCERTPA